MSEFSKIKTTILDSTLWEESPEARLVFLGMVFASDLDGNLMTRTDTALARRLNLEPDFLERGLAVITAPDPQSANQEYDGRRVVRQDGGWLVVSKRRYVDEQTGKQKAWAEKKARWRERKRAPDVSHVANGVTPPLSKADVELANVLMGSKRK